jgi:L-seryl-tRNA(Ser) seleniumtransferase
LEEFKNIPGVDVLLNHAEIKELINHSDVNLVKYAIRQVLQDVKEDTGKGKPVPEREVLVSKIVNRFYIISKRHLRKVINATGVIIHTNLGRAPYGSVMLQDAFEALNGYNNLEFDLDKATRGSRNAHASDLLKYLTKAEDVLVVNNNAAAVVLILRTLARDREVIISRGELIEIGGSFRMPDIIATSGCKMVEVGTTNKTKVQDYEQAITKNTGVLFKAHKSNYSIEGFTHEAKLKELVALGKKYRLPVVYDMGSGLLNNDVVKHLKGEPSVRQTLSTGVDLVSFSGDKLLGGPQAGIIAGKKELVQKLKKEPLLRALRVDKLTLSFLETSLKYFLNEEELYKKNLFYATLNQSPEQLKEKALAFNKILKEHGVESEISESSGQFGGGSLPGQKIASYMVRLIIEGDSARKRSAFAEKLYLKLLKQEIPVLGILRKGDICFDMLTLPEHELEFAAEVVSKVFNILAKS